MTDRFSVAIPWPPFYMNSRFLRAKTFVCSVSAVGMTALVVWMDGYTVHTMLRGLPFACDLAIFLLVIFWAHVSLISSTVGVCPVQPGPIVFTFIPCQILIEPRL
jgi:hypothetical protein